MEIKRVGRKNAFGRRGKHQPMWCETLWLFDVVGRERKITREQAVKYLRICQALGYYDYGLELTHYGHELGVLDRAEVKALEAPASWGQANGEESLSKTARLLRWLPRYLRWYGLAMRKGFGRGRARALRAPL